MQNAMVNKEGKNNNFKNFRIVLFYDHHQHQRKNDHS